MLPPFFRRPDISTRFLFFFLRVRVLWLRGPGICLAALKNKSTACLPHPRLGWSGEAVMNERALEVMPVNALWILREKIDALLERKMTSQKEELERRLAQLTGQKYKNPHRPHQTWSGRGRQPKWFVAQLCAGNAAENLLICGPQSTSEDC
jgi:DNA-binding protein H-NS